MTRSVVLLSGGLDSAVLLARESADADEVWPVHVRSGFTWETAEAEAIERLLASPSFRHRIQPLTTLHVDMRDVFPRQHWALDGTPPGYAEPDAAVFIPGRNIVLVAKTAVFAAERGAARIGLGLLAGNPFPDASATFLDAFSHALSSGLAHPLRIVAPLSGMTKAEVIIRGHEMQLPLGVTMSCLRPADGWHCGACNKCRERHDAFIEAGVEDPSRYRRSPGESSAGG